MRLFFDERVVEELRARSRHPRLATISHAMLEAARRDLALNLEGWSWIDPELVRGGPAYFEMVAAHDGRERLLRLCLAHLVTGERRFAEKARDLAAAALTRAWESYRMGDLVVAAWTVGLLILADAVSDTGALGDPRDDSSLAAKLRERMLSAAEWLAHDVIKGGQPLRRNHDAIEASTVGLVALAFREDPRAARWLALARETIDHLLATCVGEDGEWYEATPRYQCYMLHWLIPFAEACRRAGVHDYYASERVRGLFASLLHWVTPNGWNLGFNDVTHEELARMAPGILAKAASEYRDGSFLWALERVREGAPEVPLAAHQVFLHLDPERAPEPAPPVLPGAVHLRRTGIVVARTGWSKEDSLFALQCGPYMSHGHLDKSAFELYYRGTPLVLDAGCGPYLERPTYLPSEKHNVVVVDGGYPLRHVDPYYGTEGWDFCPPFHGRVLDVQWRPEVALVVADHALHARVAHAQRIALFVHPGYLVIFDELRDDSPHEYASYVHARGELETDAAVARWIGPEGVELALHVILPRPCTIERGEHELAVRSAADMKIEYVPHLWRRRDARLPYIRVPQRGAEARFFFVLAPRGRDERRLTVRQLLDVQQTVVLVDGATFRDLWICQAEGATSNVDGVSTDAHIAFLRRRDGNPTAWAVIDGRRLSWHTQTLVDSPLRTTFVGGS